MPPVATDTSLSFEVIESAIEPQRALAAGQAILDLQRYDRSYEFSAFYVSKFDDTQLLEIVKGSIKQYHGRKGELYNRYLEGNEKDKLIGSLIINQFLSIDEELHQLTGLSSDETLVQIYEPNAQMPPHIDYQKEVQSLNLSGRAIVDLFTPKGAKLIESVELNPGDLAVFRNKVRHSVRNSSEIVPRVAFSRY